MIKYLLLVSILFLSGLSYASDYERSKFGSGWADIDKDCQNTRQETLISMSRSPVQFATDKGCRVISGNWVSPFTSKTILDASKVDIDHVVPLKWAWLNGADKWPHEKRIEFANDSFNLIVVELSLNRQKGAKGLDEWLPPKNQEAHKERFKAVWEKYNSAN